MATVSGYLKLVVRLSTSRREAQIRQRLAVLESTYKGRLQALIDSDPQTALEDWSYRLKVVIKEESEVYPKLAFRLETTRTPEQIRNALEPLFNDLKQDIRSLAASDPKTTILGWHVHRAAGSFDEDEP